MLRDHATQSRAHNQQGSHGAVSLQVDCVVVLDLIGSMISTGGCIDDIVAVSAGNRHAKDLTPRRS
jgi:hypothetical protein